jgi:hypothetical protein
MILEQASTFNVVIFYCVDIFSIDCHLSAIIVGMIQVFATFISTFLVDNAGRRILLLFSEAVMGISFLALGTFFYIKHVNGGTAPVTLGWLPLVSVLLFIVAFSVGIGPLSWTIMAEILNPNVKGLCSAIAVSLVWFLSFVVNKIYSTLNNGVGIYGSFWIFSTVSIIGFFIVYFIVPETKGFGLFFQFIFHIFPKDCILFISFTGKTLDEIKLMFTPVNKKTTLQQFENGGIENWSFRTRTGIEENRLKY